MSAKEMGFMSACNDFFGMKEGQKLTDFRDEVGQLSDQDKKEIADGLEATGKYKIKS